MLEGGTSDSRAEIRTMDIEVRKISYYASDRICRESIVGGTKYCLWFLGEGSGGKNNMIVGASSENCL